MSAFLLCLISAFFIYLLTQRDFLNPATVFAFLAFLNASVFYVCGILGYGPSRTRDWWQFKEDFTPVATQVLTFYAVQCLMAIIAFKVTSKSQAGSTQEIELFGNVNRSLILSRLDQVLRSGYGSIVAFGSLSVLSVLFTLHLVEVSPAKFWEYTGYLSIKSPEGAGISNPVFGIFHQIVPYIGIGLWVFLSYTWSRGHFVLFFFALLPSLYTFLFSFCLASRFAVATLVISGTALLVAGRGNRVIGLCLLLLALWVYQGVILTRTLSGKSGTFGLAAVCSAMLNKQVLNPEGLSFLLFNVFDGGCNLGHAILRAPLTYPLAYKIKSFNPGASYWDDYATLRLTAAHKILWNCPYSAYSEVFLFGIGWLFGFLLFIMAVLIGLCRFWARFRGVVGVMVLSLSYLSFAALNLYPVRHSFRFLLLTCVVLLLFPRLTSRNRGGFVHDG
jgi:hypothetical protein